MGLLMSKTIPQILRLQVSVPHCSQDLYARAQLLQKKKYIQTDPRFLSSHIDGSPCK